MPKGASSRSPADEPADWAAASPTATSSRERRVPHGTSGAGTARAPRRPGGMPRPLCAALLAALAALIAGACATSTASPSNSSIQAADTTRDASHRRIGLGLVGVESASTWVSVPTACIGLGADDCRRVRRRTERDRAGRDRRAIRPGRAVRVPGRRAMCHIARRSTAGRHHHRGRRRRVVVPRDGGRRDARLTFAQQDAFGVLVGPSSQPPVSAGARPFALGHCGLSSGDRRRRFAGGIPSVRSTATIRMRSTPPRGP